MFLEYFYPKNIFIYKQYLNVLVLFIERQISIVN